ncbi:uncharacterized protein LOC130590250 [Beta vulgaris subsp. vulgaris]|uniref:uncharacterized protein LOC130590250 n=1 Tax=Beta vulgaris subsp. vulgaris TaxID=3555 RepID=UPI0025476C1B|nr:uncharacterized protein LOC130590250 [Beta vulgaris subsp. vulgaris]
MSNVLSWNCRGLGSIPAVNALRRVVINEKPQLVFLQETKLHSYEMERVKKRLNFRGMFVVDCVGDGRRRKGGVCLLWREDWDITILSFSTNHIDSIVNAEGGMTWRFTGIYGFPETENKAKTGALLKTLHNRESMPWLCGGDFNLMLWSVEKQGGGDFRFEEAELFREACDHCELYDLNYVGHPFTWTNNQGGDHNLQERLDRFLANSQWQTKFGHSYVTHLEKRRSDHLPILLSIRTKLPQSGKKRNKRLFRFEEMWTREEECGEVIAANWRKGGDAAVNVGRIASDLREWSMAKFGDFAKEMRMLKEQMGK